MVTLKEATADLAVLFWYYKEPVICEQRLAELRRINPEAKIFGLFGGEPADAPSFASLSRWLDDDWLYDLPHDSHWKWRNGDLMLADWFARRGRFLSWDSVVIVQWDVMMTAPVNKIFAPLATDDVYLPGLRRLDEVASFWWWVRRGTDEGNAFATYLQALHQRGSKTDLWACQFLTAVLPRRFLDEFLSYPERKLGFLEYKFPTFAKERGFRCIDLPQLRVIWEKEAVPHGRIVLSAGKTAIRSSAIMAETLSRRGARMFHPVVRRYRFGFVSVFLGAVAEQCRRLEESLRRKIRSLLRTACRMVGSRK